VRALLEVKIVNVTQQTEEKIWDAAMVMAHRYVSAYRETLLTDSQIVTAMTADTLRAVFLWKNLPKSPGLVSRTSNEITMLLIPEDSRAPGTEFVATK
jgi:hypothetical protein